MRHLCFNSIQIYVFSLIFVVVENIQPVYEQNYNLVNVVSQINGPLFVQKLHQTVYDMDEIAFLECGLTEGFDIGYEGLMERRSETDNIPLKVGSHVEMWNKLMK